MDRRILAAALLATIAAPAAAARAQWTSPRAAVPDVRERSGLYTRIVPIQPTLPVDKDRDLWYDTEWQPRHPHNWGRWWNSWKDGGLYGKPLTAKCTAVRLPFFRGTPGDSTLTADCRPYGWLGRWANFVHPMKPVGMYYANGAYVPIYDLDPVVNGPGPWPYFWVKEPHTGD